MAERRKYIAYNGIWTNSHFWRTQDQQEIDYIEDQDGNFNTWEFKWNTAARARLTKTFTNAYPNSVFKVIHPGNLEDFLMAE